MRRGKTCAASAKRKHLTLPSMPHRGEKTRRGPWPVIEREPTEVTARLFFSDLGAAEPIRPPCARSRRFCQPRKELLLADPALVVHEAP